MPTYLYECSKCHAEQEAIRKIADRKQGPQCYLCKADTKQIIIAPMVNPIILGGGSYPGYQCPMTDKYVTSRKDRREIMKQNQVVEKD